MFDLSHDYVVVLVDISGVLIIKLFSLFLSFVFLSTIVKIDFLEMLSVDTVVIFVFPANNGISVVLSVVVSVEMSMASRMGGFEIIVGVAWYLGYLLPSLLVLVSVGIFKS